MQKELQIFAITRVAADTYKKKYDEADKKRKEAWKDLNANFVPGSERFKKYKAAIEPEFQEKIKKAKKSVLNEFNREFEDLREMEIARVKSVSQGSEKMMDVLDRLNDIPISVDEFGYLAEQYGNRSYWVDRKLIILSAKNGIQECAVQPDITTKLGLLNELRDNLYSYVDKYENNNSYSADVLVADVTLQKLEKRYTNNYSGISLNARESGKRIVTDALNHGDAMERSMYLANALQTSTPDMQEGILYELCKNHEEITGDPVMRLSGVSGKIEKFKEAEYKGARRAERVIDAIRNAKSKFDQNTIIFQNLNDRHFLEAVGRTDDNELKKMVKHQQEVKKADGARQERESTENNK